MPCAAASGGDDGGGCATSPVVWVVGLGDWGHVAANADTGGYSRATGGFLLGVDFMVGAWRQGFFAGHSSTDFDVNARGSSGASSNFHLGAYGGTQWDDYRVRVGAIYTWSHVAVARRVTFGTFTDNPQGNYGAGAMLLSAEASRDLMVEDVPLTPFADLSYVNLNTGAFAETGGAAALHGRAGVMDDGFITLGVRSAMPLVLGGSNARLDGMLGLRHTVGDTTPHALAGFDGSDAFAIAGAAMARNQAVAEAGISFDVVSGAVFRLSYAGHFSGHSLDQGVQGRLAVGVN
jgi:outer membrane autotransporter protein